MKKILLAPFIFLGLVIGCSQQASTSSTSDSRIAYQLGMTLSEAQSLAKVSEAQAVNAAKSALNSQDSVVSSRLAGIDGFLSWDIQLGQARAFVDASNASLVSLKASTIFGLEDDTASNKPEVEDDELHGIMANLDETARTFTLAASASTYTVDYAQAKVKGALANGVGVEVKGTLTGMTLMATEVEVEAPEIKGNISNLNETAKTFTLTNATEMLSVDYSQATVKGMLVDGALVEVEGTLTGTQLLATKVSLEDKSEGGESETDETDETNTHSDMNTPASP